jgi:pyrroloquinoline quinone biosynthesis protein E
VFPNVREVSLRDIWYGSDAFNRYRGDGWMKSPCSECPEKAKDFGGCRCQAYALTGDARNADPVCGKSPRHGDMRAVVMQARVMQEKAQRQDMQPIVFRTDSDSRRIGAEIGP